jgi:hypothetical protein
MASTTLIVTIRTVFSQDEYPAGSPPSEAKPTMLLGPRTIKGPTQVVRKEASGVASLRATRSVPEEAGEPLRRQRGSRDVHVGGAKTVGCDSAPVVL